MDFEVSGRDGGIAGDDVEVRVDAFRQDVDVDNRAVLLGHQVDVALRTTAPDSPLAGQAGRRPLRTYQTMYAKVADTMKATGDFCESERWQFDWKQTYTRDQWLDLLPTTGGLTQLAPGQIAKIIDAVGNAVDSLGGFFTMDYTTFAATVVRTA